MSSVVTDAKSMEGLHFENKKVLNFLNFGISQ